GTLLKYYHIPGLPVLGTITGVTRTYLASDGLGSETVDLSYNGSVLATALYGPYGVGRYATGTMPTSKGYTGQRQDSGSSGLDYYGARYYDGAVGQFISADSAQGPNRYSYVGGNPETATDPTGKVQVSDPGGGAPSPVTGRHNYYSQFMQYYWDDEHAGKGYFDNQAGADQTDTDEERDGNALAAWFGLTVIRPKRVEKEGYTEPDYYVGVYGKLHHLPGGLLIPGGNVSWGDIANELFGSDRRTLPLPLNCTLPRRRTGTMSGPQIGEA
ncbi:MAG: RHS repeat-associated core domain-containing protein, partial [Ktedonobacterales bacterium]